MGDRYNNLCMQQCEMVVVGHNEGDVYAQPEAMHLEYHFVGAVFK